MRHRESLVREPCSGRARSGVGPRRRQSGISLLEVMIYLSVAGVIGVPLMLTTLTVTRSTEETNLIAKILERNRAVMHRIGSDFRRCLSGTISVTGSGSTLTFTLPGGFDGTGPTAGNVISYQVVSDTSDPDNGVDDNSNGVVDERTIRRVNQSTNETVVLGAFLSEDETGFVLNGDGVTVTLTTIGWTKGSQAQTKMTQTVTLFPRN